MFNWGTLWSAVSGFCAGAFLLGALGKWLLDLVLTKHSNMLLAKINGTYVKTEVFNAKLETIKFFYDGLHERVELLEKSGK